MASTETLEDIKARIKQVTPEETRDALESGDAVVIDTRDAVNRQDARIDGDHYAPRARAGAMRTATSSPSASSRQPAIAAAR